MESKTNSISRRALLKKGGVLWLSLAAMPLAARTAPAGATKAAKSEFHYQDHPKNGKLCANCMAFVAPQAGETSGACRIIDGPINPNGWCMAFSQKPQNLAGGA